MEEASPVFTIIEGNLHKKGNRGFFKTWKERWFSMSSDKKITYFNRKGESRPQGFINLNLVFQAEVSKENDFGSGYCFQLKTRDRIYLLVAVSEQIRTQWLNAINLALEDKFKTPKDIELIWGSVSFNIVPESENQSVKTEELADFTEIGSPSVAEEVITYKEPYSCFDPGLRSWTSPHARDMQILTFKNWINYRLNSEILVKDLFVDICDGSILIRLINVISTEAKIEQWVEVPEGNIQKIQNVNSVINFLIEKMKFFVPDVSATSVVTGNVKTIMDLIWAIIYQVEIKPINYGGLSDRFALLSWCQDQVNTYTGVAVMDFLKSFSEGYTFCVLIHSQDPSLIDLESLFEYKKLDNLRLAFSIAEKAWGIPQLLDYQDFLDEVDEISLILYLAQWWNKLK